MQIDLGGHLNNDIEELEKEIVSQFDVVRMLPPVGDG
jgi:hypothetical protein